MFLVAIFFAKNGIFNKNNTSTEGLVSVNGVETGLTLEDLVNEDTDKDGVLNWEENLWGTDPAKEDTDADGTPDSKEIQQLKAQIDIDLEGTEEYLADTGKNTETYKFSQEFFATIATLNQSGAMDEATVEKLSQTLAEKVATTSSSNLFTPSDVKTSADVSIKAIQVYNNSLEKIHSKHEIKGNLPDILSGFIIDESTVNVEVLTELDPIVAQTKKIIEEASKLTVPEDLAIYHLNFINGLQRVVENLEDIQHYEDDILLTLAAISQFENNMDRLQASTAALLTEINNRLNG